MMKSWPRFVAGAGKKSHAFVYKKTMEELLMLTLPLNWVLATMEPFVNIK